MNTTKPIGLRPANPPLPAVGTVLVKVCYPSASIEMAMLVLNLTRDQVLNLIDEGELPWSWNLARKGTHTRHIRIDSLSLTRLSNRVAALKEDHAQVLNRLLPVKQGNPTAWQLGWIFCSGDRLLGGDHDFEKLGVAGKGVMVGIHLFLHVGQAELERDVRVVGTGG
jgi:hypothetical protein